MNTSYQLGADLIFGTDVPFPEQLKNKDKRADSAARAAVLSTTLLLQSIPEIDLQALNIIVVNREGCRSHIQKVSNGIAKKSPAQGFFVRGGPQTLATYTALAVGSHGSAFTLVGQKEVLTLAVTAASCLASGQASAATVLTAVGFGPEQGYKAKSALINSALSANEESSVALSLQTVLS